MDKFTLEEIEAAVRTTRGRWFETGEDIEGAVKTILAELTRPKHSFREGEVAATVAQDPELGTEYVQWEDGKWKIPLRPLTLSEMPKAVEDLREAVKRIPNETVINGTHGIEMLRDMAEEALAAFDSEISHE